MTITEYALNNRALMKFFIAVLVVGGIFAFLSMSKLEDPEIKVKQAMVITVYPGASAHKVELEVTDVLEKSIRSMGEIDNIQSRSLADVSQITVEMKSTVNPEELEQQWDMLRRKVTNAQASLPDGVRPSVVMDDFGDVYGMFYAMTTDGIADEELIDYAQLVKRELQDIEGVRKVEIYGDRKPCINIEIIRDKMANLGVHPLEVLSTLNNQNKTVYPGYFDSGDERIRVAVSDDYKSIEDIQNLIIQGHEQDQLRLGDIASVTRGYDTPSRNQMRYDGARALGVSVSMEKGGNVVDLGKIVDRKLEQLKQSRIPVGIEFQKVFFQPDQVRDAIGIFMVNLVESIFVVILILMLTMGFRSGAIIGAGLLIIVLGSFVVLYLFDGTMQRVSLAALIVAMGMLVDNAIVVTDNAQIAIKRGIRRRQALIDGATTPQWGLLGATMIAVFSFLPLYLAQSSVAEMIKPLFIVLAVSLLLSWVLALAQTTVFGNFILKEGSGETGKDPYDTPFYHKFGKFLRLLIRFKGTTMLVMVGLFMLAMTIMGLMPQNFFPNMDKPYLRADCFLPEGYSIRETEKEMGKIEEFLLQQEEVVNVSATYGSSPLRYYLASTSFGPKSNFGNFLVEVKDKKYTAQVEERLNKYVRENYPDILIRSSLFKLSPAVEANIEFGFIGENIDTLTMLTEKAMSIMHECDMVTDIKNSWGNKVPVWEPAYSQERGQRLGITRQAVAYALKIATNGLPLGDYREKDLFMPILLKEENIESSNIDNMKTLPVFSQSGYAVPLAQVVDSFAFGYNYNVIKRYNRDKVMMAQCDSKRGANTMAAFAQVKKAITEGMDIPQGYRMQVFGENETQEESNSAMAANLPLTFILMFIVLLFLFKTYRKPTIILLMVPLIFIGVVFGLAVTGKMLDFFAILGVLGLIGMNIKNAIVLVDQIGIEEEKGTPRLEAIIEATKSRIVPVAMASGTTILGMLPLLFDAMFGGMAACIMGGLLVASLLTIFVLPVTYSLLFRVKVTDTPEVRMNEE